MLAGVWNIMFFFFLSSLHFSLHAKICFMNAKIFFMIRKRKKSDKKKKNILSVI